MTRAAYEQIEDLVESCADVAGDVAEFGVWRGDTFLPLARWAARNGRRAHAVDTFTGMLDPTERDMEPNGVCHYPRGALGVGGSEALRRALAPFGEAACVWEGAIPGVLRRLPTDARFAFAHVDLDHYVPTLATLRWVWPHMTPGGILCCHDWFPGHDYLAAGAIHDWMAELNDWQIGGTLPSNHIWFKVPL